VSIVAQFCVTSRQDNELSIVRSAAEAGKFEAAFAAMWRQAK